MTLAEASASTVLIALIAATISADVIWVGSLNLQ